MMEYKVIIAAFLIFLIQASFSLANPVTSVEENVTERDFHSRHYTNQDSVEAHQIVVYSEDGEHSQIHLNYRLPPKTTNSPDGNYSVYKKALDAGDGVGIEDFVINETQTGNETNIKNIITMGYYAVAFSPDSKMYAAPRIIFSEDGRNAQYAIDICSVQNNTIIHREITPFYKENTKTTPMDWDRSTIYEVYWSEDGNCIIYDTLGADIDGGTYPSYVGTTKLNLDYTELRRINGDDVSQDELANDSETPENSPAQNDLLAVPGFEITGAAIALVLGRKIRQKEN